MDFKKAKKAKKFIDKLIDLYEQKVFLHVARTPLMWDWLTRQQMEEYVKNNDVKQLSRLNKRAIEETWEQLDQIFGIDPLYESALKIFTSNE